MKQIVLAIIAIAMLSIQTEAESVLIKTIDTSMWVKYPYSMCWVDASNDGAIDISFEEHFTIQLNTRSFGGASQSCTRIVGFRKFVGEPSEGTLVEIDIFEFHERLSKAQGSLKHVQLCFGVVESSLKVGGRCAWWPAAHAHVMM